MKGRLRSRKFRFERSSNSGPHIAGRQSFVLQYGAADCFKYSLKWLNTCSDIRKSFRQPSLTVVFCSVQKQATEQNRIFLYFRLLLYTLCFVLWDR